jgi:hypothetical protein
MHVSGGPLFFKSCIHIYIYIQYYIYYNYIYVYIYTHTHNIDESYPYNCKHGERWGVHESSKSMAGIPIHI